MINCLTLVHVIGFEILRILYQRKLGDDIKFNFDHGKSCLCGSLANVPVVF